MKDFVYKLRLIDWHTKESLGIPEESNGIITILMQPGSTVHNLKEKVMQWLGDGEGERLEFAGKSHKGGKRNS